MADLSQILKAINSTNPKRAIELVNQSNLPAGQKRSLIKTARDRMKATATDDKKTGSTAINKMMNAIPDAIKDLDQWNVSLGRANASLAASQEQTNKVAEALMNLSARNAEIGMTGEKAKKIYIDLADSSMRMKKGFDKSSLALAEQVGLWESFGVNASESRRFMTQLNSTLGMSATEMSKYGRTLQAYGIKTGQSFATVMRDVGDNMGSFLDILDTGRMTRQTLIFQARAKAMGTDVQSLVGLLEKFETMDQAQMAGAKLNQTLSALGGSFDAVKASTMDYPERMEYIATAIQRVAPRIRAAGPRAQRLYMRSLKESLGVSPAMLRKLMTFKPGDMISAERDLTAGRVPTAVSREAERAQAKRLTTIRDTAIAFEDALKRTPIRIAFAAGLPLTGGADMLKTGMGTIFQRGVNMFTETVEQNWIPAGVTMLKNATSMDEKIGQMLKQVDAFVARQNTINTEQTATLNKVHALYLKTVGG